MLSVVLIPGKQIKNKYTSLEIRLMDLSPSMKYVT